MNLQSSIQGFSRAKAVLVRWQSEAEGRNREILETLGAVAESQVRRRLSEEKQSPDGTAWPDLDPDYQARKGNHSSGGLLEREGNLIDSIEFQVQGSKEVMIGTNLIYAATHDQGDQKRSIPQRHFLGVSDENQEELFEALKEILEERIA